jgi:alcohol dehydrogenase class IV
MWTSAPNVHLQLDRETTIWSGGDGVTHQLEAFGRFLNSGKRTENRSPFADALATLKLGLELSKSRS